MGPVLTETGSYGHFFMNGGRLILIVDDEPAVRRLLGQLVAMEGFPVLVADGGSQALALFRDHASEVGLVLLDERMPRPDGPATLAAMRDIDPCVRCCFMTGDSSPESRQRLQALGADFLPKPFRIDDLRAVLRKVFARSV